MPAPPAQGPGQARDKGLGYNPRLSSNHPGIATMSIDQLAETAQAMVAAGKGIIAIDESTATIKKRFDGVGIECTEENRRAYREMLLTTWRPTASSASASRWRSRSRSCCPSPTWRRRSFRR